MQSYTRPSLGRSSRLTTKLLAAVLCVAGLPSLQAASGSWTGLGADSLWSTAGNWSPISTPPGTGGQTATFNGAGNSKTTIDLGAGINVSNIVFDTASAAAYTIGAGAAGSQTLTLNSNLTVNATVTTSQLLNSNLVLNSAVTNTPTFTNTVTNNSTTGSLTFAGGISTVSSGARTLAISGAGATSISGNITNGTGTVAITKGGAGTLTLSGTNSFSSLSQGNGVINVSGGSTTTAIAYTSGGTTITVSGGTLTATSIASGSNSNGRVLNLTGGTFVSNGNVFASGVAGAISINGGTLKSGNASGITVFDDNNSIAIGGGGATFDTTVGNITLGSGVALAGSGKLTFVGVSGNTFAADALSVANGTPLGFNLGGVSINNSTALVSLTTFTETADGGTYAIDFGGFNFDTIGSYKLIGFSSMSGTFVESDFAAANSTVGSGLEADFVFDGSSLSYVVTTAIPEPSTFGALAGLIILGFSASRRRSV